MIVKDDIGSLIDKLRVAAKKMFDYGVPICRFGIFGSAVHDSKVLDVDTLLTLNLPSEDQPDFNRVVSEAVARMEGDYSLEAPVNIAAKPFVSICVDIIHKETSLPLVYGLGPSNRHSYQGQWIHLNGPMSDGIWSLFTKEYPIHGLTIRNNYITIVGDPPGVSAINGDTLLKYSEDMVRRNRAMPTLKTADKLIRVLALLGGEPRAMRDAAIGIVFGWNPPLAREISKFFITSHDNEASAVTLSLVTMVSSVAKLMKLFNFRTRDKAGKGDNSI